MFKPDAEQNVAHYRSRLHMGAEPVTREVILKLLLDEEKMLGLTREQLARIDRHIEKLRRIIADEQKFIERRKLIGIDTESSTLLLATLNDLSASSPKDCRCARGRKSRLVFVLSPAAKKFWPMSAFGTKRT